MTGKKRTALITGGTKGVGRGIANRFAQLGFNLVVAFFDEDKAEARAAGKELTDLGGTVLVLEKDIKRRSEVEDLFREAIARFGSIDIVVANAGFEVIDKSFAEMDEDALDHVVDLNIKGTFFTLQQASRHVVDGGRIIATASSITLNPPKDAGVYASTKAAVRTMVEVLSKELGARQITVNSIAPGQVKGAGVFTNISPELEDKAIEGTPLGRMTEPVDIAGSAVFLISDDARMITGHHLGITGGAVQ